MKNQHEHEHEQINNKYLSLILIKYIRTSNS